MILVSACLVGVRCRYDGGHARNRGLMEALREQRYLPVCPEVAGGLGVPRPPAHMVEGGGFDVLDGKALLVDEEGRDVTSCFLEGGARVLRIAREFGVRMCYLKARSPSCGCVGYPGRPVGVTAALLLRAGFPCREVNGAVVFPK